MSVRKRRQSVSPDGDTPARGTAEPALAGWQRLRSQIRFKATRRVIAELLTRAGSVLAARGSNCVRVRNHVLLLETQYGQRSPRVDDRRRDRLLRGAQGNATVFAG